MKLRSLFAGISLLVLGHTAFAANLGPNGSTTAPSLPGGSAGQLQYNNGGTAFGGYSIDATVIAAMANAVNATGGLAGYIPRRVTVGQVRVPMILPSSGSMGNNGALTLTTALDQAYPSAYFYMPAGAIASGSAAGFYYGTMGSTTAVTLFNNPYVSGTATIPGTPTAFVTTGPGAYNQTSNTNLTCYTLSIAGSTLGLYDEIQAHGEATYNNNADLKTYILNYGSFLFGAGSPTTTVQTPFQGGFANAGSLTRQTLTGSLNTTLTGNTAVETVGSVTTTSAQNLTVQLKLATATTPLDYIILQNVVFERIQAAAN